MIRAELILLFAFGVWLAGVSLGQHRVSQGIETLEGKVSAIQAVQTELEHRLTLENEQMLFRVKAVHESCRRQCSRKCGVNI